MTNTAPSGQADPAQITDLLTWAQWLTHAGATADPAQRVAYLAAKAELLARIADQHAHHHPCHAELASQIAADARAIAQLAVTLLPAPTKDIQ
jgi:hypothetical protein